MDKAKKYLNIITPYLILLIFTLFSTYLYFYKGLNTGDDFFYHLGNIMDEYKTILDGEKLSPISGNLIAGLGVGNRLFYSPLSHFSVALMTLFLKLFNGSMFLAYKLVVIITVFISGVFMYRFMMHITKNSKVASLIAATCFILYPYRMFDAFCRLAFAETYAIAFLPLFFMGLYDVCHFKDNKINVIAFIEVIFGGAILYLSHNITALYAYLAGIIYLLCNIKNIIKLFKNKRYILYCGVSVILLIGIASFAFVSQFELLSMNYYNVSDSSIMWTDIAHVVNRTSEEFNYSGFLNLPYINKEFASFIKISTIIIDMFMYIVAAIIFIILDIALSEVKKLKYFHTLISSIVLFLLVSLISRRIEVYLSTIVFLLLYLYIIYLIKTPTNENETTKKIYLDISFWYSIAMIILCVFMMESKKVWEVLPSFMLNIQFPWRLWALVQLFASILVGLFVYYFNYKKAVIHTFIILMGFLVISSMPLLEKRIVLENFTSSRWVVQEDENFLDKKTTLGHNQEYIPQIFRSGSGYESKYNNSLYTSIYIVTNSSSYISYHDYTFKPVFLEGNGTIEINKAYSPIYEMDISVKSDCLIQMPLFYYPGYEVSVLNVKTNEKYSITPVDVDGLISFDLKQGDYEVLVNYKGTKLRNVSKVIFGVSLSITSLALLYGLFIENDKYKKYIKLKNNKTVDIDKK